MPPAPLGHTASTVSYQAVGRLVESRPAHDLARSMGCTALVQSKYTIQTNSRNTCQNWQWLSPLGKTDASEVGFDRFAFLWVWGKFFLAVCISLKRVFKDSCLRGSQFILALDGESYKGSLALWERKPWLEKQTTHARALPLGGESSDCQERRGGG